MRKNKLIKLFFTSIVMLFFVLGQAQKISHSVQSLHRDIHYYLPTINYNPKITSPEKFLGFQVGEWHVTHDKLVEYMELLSEESDRITIETYAYSHEKRALKLLHISTPENLQNIDNIRENHLKLTDSKISKSLNINDMPLVLYQGYSIHGNESSGANAALLVAYYLAAGEDKSIDELLKNTIILLDPCYNPDGFQRFSSWVNMHKSSTLVTDPKDREYNETWPGGRFNHYWTDLNRDWLLLTHPESRGRIANFHKWKPNILTDHHEMGTNSTFFFQPGVPERTNPNTPQKNQDLTEKIGIYHAKALDEIGSMYYSKESFDDYYYGKGSTYPDIHGSIGILFEQASSRGHAQESNHGILDFPFTIRNQVVTSLSTQKAAKELRVELLEFQRQFYIDAAKAGEMEGYFKIHKKYDFHKAAYLVDLLRQHDIQVFDDEDYEGFFYVPRSQKQSLLIKTIFEKVNTFKANVFYDVSAWTFPLAFDIQVDEVKNVNLNTLKLVQENIKKEAYFPKSADSLVALAFEWSDMHTGALLTQLLDKEILCKSMDGAFTAETLNGKRKFQRGTIVIPLKIGVFNEVRTSAAELEIDVFGIKTGFNVQGNMIGTPSSTKMEKAKILMIVGDRIDATDAGEIWFHCDLQLGIPVTKIEAYKLENIDLNRYTTIILPDGNYSYLSDRSYENIQEWVKKGGNLIVFKRAINSLARKKIIDIEIINETSALQSDSKDYGDHSDHSAKHVIGGAIFQTTIDITYPLFYGYTDSSLAVFKSGTLAISSSPKTLANPMIYDNNALVSGYASQENIERIKGTAGIMVFGLGAGKIVCSVDNPLFRGYWIGGHKLFDNMIYLTKSVENAGMRE